MKYKCSKHPKQEIETMSKYDDRIIEMKCPKCKRRMDYLDTDVIAKLNGGKK